MKRTTVVMIATALTGFGAVSFASSLATSDAFGPSLTSVALEDTRLDADQLFSKIDMNKDGALSIDEYASQAVVRASLARFNKAVVIDGRATFHVQVPDEATNQIAAAEQTAIDAVARNEFYRISGNDASLDKSEWIQSRLTEFADADFDEDGQLRGAELELYALTIARYQLTMS